MSEVMIIGRILPKYRKDVLDLLYKRMDFLMLHSRHKNGVKEVTAAYSRVIPSFQFASKESNLFLFTFTQILKQRPKVIIHEYSIGIASLFPTYWLARILGIKFILWGHGYDHTKGFHPENSLADKLRIYLAKKADAVIFYGVRAKEKFKAYINEDKLFVANNCLNTRRLSAIRSRLEAEGRENVKRRMGWKHQHNLLFIGRMLTSKKPELLIGIYEQLQKRNDSSLGIHYVGDGPQLALLKQLVVEKGLRSNVFFHGAIHDDRETGELLFVSDLMVMPGYVGLSVNHAFNFDCPVVTFQQGKDGPFHSPEIEYLIPGKTGFIVAEHTVQALANTVEKFLADPEWRQDIQRHIRNAVDQTCSVDRFLEGFHHAVDYALNDRNFGFVKPKK